MCGQTFGIDFETLHGKCGESPLLYMLVTAESMKISDFDNLISADNLVLIDFYATWCGACGAIDGALDRLVFSMGDVVTLVRIDTTSRTSYDLVRRYNVVALPTLMLFQRGEVLWRECGVITYERLAHVIRRYRSVGAY